MQFALYKSANRVAWLAKKVCRGPACEWEESMKG